MATSLQIEDFQSWLSAKLNCLGTDEGVFGSYITSILSGDETLEDKTEALQGILAEISGSDINSLCTEILKKWKEYNSDAETVCTVNNGPVEEVEERLVRLLEKNTLSTPIQKEYTEEEKRIREAILSQYAEEVEEEEEEVENKVKENGLVKNTNVSSVVQAAKEKREKLKVDCQKKKEKDREDRERQKQQQQEKKEKRKTHKGERRR